MHIVVYSKQNCPFCVKAKNLLQQKGLEYTEVEIGRDMVKEDFVSLFPDAKTVPLILIDGERIGGYTDLVEWADVNGPQFLLG